MYFILGRAPAPGEQPVTYRLFNIAGQIYIRHIFKEELGPYLRCLIWSDYVMQLQILAFLPRELVCATHADRSAFERSCSLES